jgi:iron-sulfur cluster assembly accessory protein
MFRGSSFLENDAMVMETQTSAAPTTPAKTDAEPVLTLTPAACQAIKEAMSAQKLTKLRVGVVAGGCSGFSYDLELVNESKPTDVSFELDGVTVILDGMSAQYLKGVQIDFVTGLQGSGFKFSNPNARSTCGCGSSFSA